MGIRASRLRRVTVLLGLPVAVMIAGTGASAAFGGSTPQPVNPAVEAQNYAKTTKRQAIYLTPRYQAQRLRAVGTQNTAAAVAAQTADQEREFPTDLCWNGNDGCAGDVRLYNWQAHGYGPDELGRPGILRERPTSGLGALSDSTSTTVLLRNERSGEGGDWWGSEIARRAHLDAGSQLAGQGF
jgi:hypothetical protein